MKTLDYITIPLMAVAIILLIAGGPISPWIGLVFFIMGFLLIVR